MVSVHQWSRRLGFNPGSSQTKELKKWYLMPPCLTLNIIRYRSRVKWSNQGKGVIAIEKVVFEWPSPMITNFTFTFLIYYYYYNNNNNPTHPA